MAFHQTNRPRRAGSLPLIGLKNLEDHNLDLDLLQPLEIPQNGQDIGDYIVDTTF